MRTEQEYVKENIKAVVTAYQEFKNGPWYIKHADGRTTGLSDKKFVIRYKPKAETDKQA